MDVAVWKVGHVIGVLLLFVSLGGLVALRDAAPERQRGFKILHGWGLAIVFLVGFKLLSSLGLSSPGSWPGWVWGKLGMFLLLGASPVLIRRAGRRAEQVLLALVLLGGVAAWLALAKPGV